MNYRSLPFLSAATALLSLGACSNESDPVVFPGGGDAVELGVTAGVALTKSAIIGGTQTGTASTTMQKVAVRAAGSASSYSSGNDYAVYLQNGSGGWAAAPGADKIMLTAEEATVYAYHPADVYDANGNPGGALTASGTVGTNATISFSLFEGGEAATGSPAQKLNSTIPDDGAWAADKIFSAPGDIDYMWAGNAPKASNGKAAGATSTSSVSLEMQHALALVSFAVCKDNTYKNAGKLTRIVLKNASGSALQAGTATMNIQTGAISVTAGKAGVFTRLIKDDNGVAIPLSTASAIPQYSLLAFPGSVARDGIQAIFTIDGADYPVSLAKNATAVNWAAGTNCVYNVKLTGKELGITSVTVQKWGTVQGGDLDIN